MASFSNFTEYEVGTDSVISVDLGSLRQILKRAGPNDLITLEVAESKLKVGIKGKTTRSFSLPLIDVEEKEQKVPELTFPVCIKTTSSLFADAVEDVDIVAESVSFEADKQHLVLHGESDLSQAKIEIKPDDVTTIESEGVDVVKSKYSIEYLKKIIGASKLTDVVSIRFNKDYPLRLDYIAVDKVHMSFILAPRVEND